MATLLRCIEGIAVAYCHQGPLVRFIGLYQQMLEYCEPTLASCNPRSLHTALNCLLPV